MLKQVNQSKVSCKIEKKKASFRTMLVFFMLFNAHSLVLFLKKFNYSYQMASVHESSVCSTEFILMEKNMLQMVVFHCFCYGFFSFMYICKHGNNRRLVKESLMCYRFACRPHSIQINHVPKLFVSRKTRNSLCSA